MRNKYFLLRHGEVQKEEGIIYDWPSISTFPLTKRGKEQIAKVAQKLKNQKIDLIYSSDSLRTRQTAEIIMEELGLKVNFDSRLRDINLGVYWGRKEKEFYRDFPPTLERFYKKRPKEGENWTGLKKRMLRAIKEIDKKHKGKTILIISHGDPLWLLEGAMKSWSNRELLNQKLKGKLIKIGELRELRI